MVLCLRKIMTRVPFPITPITKIKKNRTGTKYVSGLSWYGIKSVNVTLECSSVLLKFDRLTLNTVALQQFKKSSVVSLLFVPIFVYSELVFYFNSLLQVDFL